MLAQLLNYREQVACVGNSLNYQSHVYKGNSMKNNAGALIFLRVLVCVFLLFASANYISAQTLPTLDVWLGYDILINSIVVTTDGDLIQFSDISPANVSFGLGTTIPILPFMSFAPSVDFSSQRYIQLESGKVVPTQSETPITPTLIAGDSAFAGPVSDMLGLRIALPIIFNIDIVEAFSIGIGLSPTLIFRVPVGNDNSENTAPLVDYFLGTGRFFYPELQLLLKLGLESSTRVAINGRLLFPIFNLWDEFDTPFSDEMIIGIGIKMIFSLEELFGGAVAR